MITRVPGIKVGHYTDETALTGCTVVLCPPNAVGGCDVRGSSPGSRELALLASEKTMQEVHAILLTGGSAFGLAAADGVMRYLEEKGIGYQTPWIRVPIVPAAVVFDINIGDPKVRPDAKAGFEACRRATTGEVAQGNVGAGTGVTVGKWAGAEYRMKGGVGTSALQVGDIIVGAIAVVNAVGDVIDEKGSILAGARNSAGEFLGVKDSLRPLAKGKILSHTNTTLVVFATNGRFSKVEVNRIAQRAQDGLARAIIPAHTSFDGDVSFALATGQVDASFDLVAEMAVEATAQAIRNSVKAAKTLDGVPGLLG